MLRQPKHLAPAGADEPLWLTVIARVVGEAVRALLEFLANG